MKLLLLVSFYTAVLAYSDIDNSFDMNEFVKNRTEFKKLLDCYLDKGPCTTKVMVIGKSHAREATLDACSECDDVQKHMYRIFIEGIKREFPEVIPEYIEKFDNSKEHFAQLEAEMKSV